MTPFEQELKKALSREDPPETFKQRVLEKVAPKTAHDLNPVPFGWWPWTYWRTFLVLALLVVFVGGIAYRHHQHELQGQAAKRQLLLAMRIAGAELHEAQLRVKRIESPEVVVQ